MIKKVAIGFSGVVAVMLLLAGNVSGERGGPSAVHEQKAVAMDTVRFECDPCDYNVDYGETYELTGRAPVEKKFVEIKCDPCDYNLDYGHEEGLTEK